MEIVCLNVGGIEHKIAKATLAKYPETFLALLIDDTNSALAKKDEKGYYFIDRNPVLFPFVLDFYRTGRIVYPTIIKERDFLEELKFWGIFTEPILKPLPTLEKLIDVHSLDTYFLLYSKQPGIKVNTVRQTKMILAQIYRNIEHALERGIREIWSLAPPKEFLKFFQITIIMKSLITIVRTNDNYLIEYMGIKREYPKDKYYFPRDVVSIIYYSY